MSGAANGNDEHQTCTICVEPVVVQCMERASARLRCGHYFHLDCIGSAFNLGGKMQCPNCRTEEVGDWHYGTVQVFGGQSNAAPPNPNVEEPDDLSFDLTAQELHNFMVNGLPEDIPEYLRSRGPRNGGRRGSITLTRVILTPNDSHQATGSARARPNHGPRGRIGFNNGN